MVHAVGRGRAAIYGRTRRVSLWLVSTEDRAAACLVLLYAQPVSRIVALSTDDLTISDDGTYLRLGTEPLVLLPPLDALVTSLPIAKPFGAASTLADERWLFPGKWAGHHQHPTSLMGSLNQLGITTRASRSAAMLHLAATVPPAVFASLIGISIAPQPSGLCTPAATGPPTVPSAPRRPAQVSTSSLTGRSREPIRGNRGC